MDANVVRFIEEAMAAPPLFIVGSGSSMGAGIPGMGALAEYLARNVSTNGFDACERGQWCEIAERLAKEPVGLESALQEAGERLGRRVVMEIVEKTWCCIAGGEQELLLKLACGGDPAGFVRLLKRYAGSTSKVVHVMTTNYDHLIEWSAASAGWPVWDGFHEGPIGVPLSSAELGERMRRTWRLGKKWVSETARHVRLYKPHGSLGWFRFPDGRIKKLTGVGLHHLPQIRKAGLVPAIVIPGAGKYLETHFEPYSAVFDEMRRALRQAEALLFVGFGFNDDHIAGSLTPVLRSGDVPKIVLAKQFTPSFERMMAARQIRNFVAIRQQGSASMVASDTFSPLLVDIPGLWTLRGMMNQVWGEEDHDEWTRLVSSE
jgi:hypothetical protein